MKKFLGFESMSRDDHLRAGLLGLVLLSLECVVAGLVTGGELRGWVIHAVAAALGLWAMTDLAPLAVRASGVTAIVAVFNEAIMYIAMGESLKYIVPAFLLLGISIWVLERSLPVQTNEQVVLAEPSAFGVSSGWDDGVSNLKPPSSQSLSNNFWAPVISIIGVVMALIGFLYADWIIGRAFFGLVSSEFSYSEIRSLWNQFGVPAALVEAFVGFAYVLGYVGMMLAVVGSASAFFRQFKVDQPWRIAGALFVGTTATLQLMVIIGLLSAEANITVLSGAWLAPVGLGLATLGFWASTAK